MLTEPQHKVDRSVLPKKGEEKKTQRIVTSGKNSDDALTLSSRLRQLELWVESEISWRGGGTPPALGDNKNPLQKFDASPLAAVRHNRLQRQTPEPFNDVHQFFCEPFDDGHHFFC